MKRSAGFVARHALRGERSTGLPPRVWRAFRWCLRGQASARSGKLLRATVPAGLADDVALAVEHEPRAERGRAFSRPHAADRDHPRGAAPENRLRRQAGRRRGREGRGGRARRRGAGGPGVPRGEARASAGGTTEGGGVGSAARRPSDEKRAPGRWADALRAGRVAAGGFPPAAPTDPDVRVSRIRLFTSRSRPGHAVRMRGDGSGYRCRICFIRSHVTVARCDRRLSHFRHTRSVS